jgi:hypothetical protein
LLGKVVLATKRDTHFLMRTKQAIAEVSPNTVFVPCFFGLQNKMLEVISKRVPMDQMNDDPNFLNIKEKEMIFHLAKAVFTVPTRHGMRAVQLAGSFLQEHFSRLSTVIFNEIITNLLTGDSESMPQRYSLD